jgi:hypothetical protein
MSCLHAVQLHDSMLAPIPKKKKKKKEKKKRRKGYSYSYSMVRMGQKRKEKKKKKKKEGGPSKLFLPLKTIKRLKDVSLKTIKQLNKKKKVGL